MSGWQTIEARAIAFAEVESPKYQSSTGIKTQLRLYAFDRGIDRIEFKDMAGDAITTERSDSKFTVVLNRSHHKSRHRFSIAHELAHLIVEPLIEHRAVHRRKFARGQDPEGRRIESLCNRLASVILMPKVSVDDIASGSDWSASCIPTIAKAFDVSFEAAARRFVNLHHSSRALLVWRVSADDRPTYTRNTIWNDALGRCTIRFVDNKSPVSARKPGVASGDRVVSTNEDIAITRGYFDRSTTSFSKQVRTETFARGRAPYRTMYSVVHVGN